MPHLHLCNRAGFRDNAAKSGKPGHNRDCPGQTGTLGNYVMTLGAVARGVHTPFGPAITSGGACLLVLGFLG